MTWSKDKSAIVYFDGTEHDWLSNFHSSVVNWTQPDGKTIVCPTVENAFQASKVLDVEEFIRIALAGTPGEAKRLGRSTHNLRPDWEDVKVDVMRRLLVKKFMRGSTLANRLKRTGDVLLVEGNHWHDNVWGDCICGERKKCEATGQNLLGTLLMEVRATLL